MNSIFIKNLYIYKSSMNRQEKNDEIMDDYYHEKIMKTTCEFAYNGIDSGFGPFACIITDASKNVVGIGNNMVTIEKDPTLHAEIVAIRNACKNLNIFSLKGHTIYTSCEPCPMCLSAIYWSHIDKIYYGNTREDAKNIGFDDSFIYDEVKLDIEERKIPMIQMCRDYANESFQKWATKKKKICY